MRYRRTRTCGGTFFFTVVTEGRRPILLDNIARLRNAFRHVLRTRPFTIDAIVVLPDHIHAIWTLPQDDDDYPLRWMLIKRHFSCGLKSDLQRSPSRQKKREKGVWQRRYWEHRVRDEQDCRRHVDYIHYNPVKHGYVEAPADWAFSTFGRFVERGIYPRHWSQDCTQIDGHAALCPSYLE